jgi:hypothetical protein
MAKLKNSFSRTGSPKLPALSTGTPVSASLPKTAVTRDTSGKKLTTTNTGTVVQALRFGTFHSKVTGSGSSSPWGSLLGSASGGASSVLSGGILSNGTLEFVGKLLSLFGGSKASTAVPQPFVMPASQQQSINVGPGGAASSVSLGIQPSSNAGSPNGPVYQTSSTQGDHATQSTQIVQVVKQALLTSSSLNDVISEI